MDIKQFHATLRAHIERALPKLSEDAQRLVRLRLDGMVEAMAEEVEAVAFRQIESFFEYDGQLPAFQSVWAVLHTIYNADHAAFRQSQTNLEGTELWAGRGRPADDRRTVRPPALEPIRDILLVDRAFRRMTDAQRRRALRDWMLMAEDLFFEVRTHGVRRPDLEAFENEIARIQKEIRLDVNTHARRVSGLVGSYARHLVEAKRPLLPEGYFEKRVQPVLGKWRALLETLDQALETLHAKRLEMTLDVEVQLDRADDRWSKAAKACDLASDVDGETMKRLKEIYARRDRSTTG
jgi:hypothetical protein